MVLVGLLTLILLAPASRLRLLTDLPELLPHGADAAEDYRLFLDLFGGFERVYVILVGPSGVDSRDSLLAAVEELTESLQSVPEIGSVRAGLDPEDQEFFLRQVVRRAPLLVSDQDLDEIRRRIEPEALRRRAEELRALVHSPAGRFHLSLAVHDPLGLWDLLGDRLSLAGGLPLDPLTSTFVSEDGEVALLLVTPEVGEIDAEGGRRLAAALDTRLAAVTERFPELEPMAVGGPLYAAQDEQRIRQDMEGTITGSVVACSLILFLAFGGVALPLLTLAVLGVALVATAAVLSLGLGAVTGVGVGFAAVLVGLGVDFGIHGCARYRQRRLLGDSAVAAVEDTFRHAGPAILTAAMTTAGAFAVLGAAHFRPLRELGILVSVGIVLILVAFATLGSALLSWVSPGPAAKRPATAGGFVWKGLQRLPAACVELATARSRSVLGLAVLVTMGAVWGLTDLRLDPDLRALRPVDHPAFDAEAVLVERLGLGLGTATVVLPGRNLDEALASAASVTEELRREPLSQGLSVTSPADFMASASQLSHRLETLSSFGLGSAVTTFENELQQVNLNPRAFESGLSALGAFGAGRDTDRPPADQWPEALGELLRIEDDGRAWAALRLRLEPGAHGLPESWVDDLRGRLPGAAVASATRLGGAMKELAARDFKNLSWAAGLMILFVVGISFRGRVRPALLCLVPVALGSVWMLGLWGSLGRSLDLLSLAVLPILLGIGIDDGLHAVHGAFDRRRPGNGWTAVGESVRVSGPAMTLTTVTTCAGFGSLAGSAIPGLKNGGILVAGGVVLCLSATLFVLPALGAVFGRRLADQGTDMAKKD